MTQPSRAAATAISAAAGPTYALPEITSQVLAACQQLQRVQGDRKQKRAELLDPLPARCRRITLRWKRS
ncbi:hypothetical protein ACLK1S_02990 [Escherichia coli]